MPIIKSTSRKGGSVGQLVDYIHRDDKEKEVDEKDEKAIKKAPQADVTKETLSYMYQEEKEPVAYDKTFSYLHNMPGIIPNDTKSIEQAFKENDQFRKVRKNGVEIFHEVMSFHPDDSSVLHQRPEIIADMARKYLEARAPHALAVAKLHKDKDHIHIHFMVAANEVGSSKSLRMSKAKLMALHEGMQKYQLETYPELEKSYVGNRDKQKYQEQKKTDKAYVREQLHTVLAHARDEKNFVEKVKQSNLETYRYRDNLMGVVYNGKKYRFKRLLGKEHEGIEKIGQWNDTRKVVKTYLESQQKEQIKQEKTTDQVKEPTKEQEAIKPKIDQKATVQKEPSIIKASTTKEIKKQQTLKAFNEKAKINVAKEQKHNSQAKEVAQSTHHQAVSSTSKNTNKSITTQTSKRHQSNQNNNNSNNRQAKTRNSQKGNSQQSSNSNSKSVNTQNNKGNQASHSASKGKSQQVSNNGSTNKTVSTQSNKSSQASKSTSNGKGQQSKKSANKSSTQSSKSSHSHSTSSGKSQQSSKGNSASKSASAGKQGGKGHSQGKGKSGGVGRGV